MNTDKAIVQPIKIALPGEGQFSFDIKRDDCIDEVVSGNKWRKLKYAIQQAKKLSKTGILTFGGAFSNHLVATAKTCQLHGLNAIGIVRGEELNENSNASLKDCVRFGMKLLFVSRAIYKERYDYAYLSQLKMEYNSYFVVPEGGASFYGVVGCQEIMTETTNDYDHVVLAAGTGTTAAGVVLSVPLKTKVHVIPVLKADGLLYHELNEKLNWVANDIKVTDELLEKVTIHEQFHFGGYAKITDELIQFMKDFHEQTNVQLDPVYTSKAMYGLIELTKQKVIQPNQRTLFIHTGGLQGLRGLD